jgi:tetratricopeptide (TPR) repeat protein
VADCGEQADGSSLGDFQKTVTLLSKTSKPDEKTLALKGLAHYNLKQYPQAAADFEDAAKQNPGASKYAQLAARSYQAAAEAGPPAGKKKLTEKALKLDPQIVAAPAAGIAIHQQMTDRSKLHEIIGKAP